ncbi:hypothetical protein DAY19_06060 [Halobacteriovorax vibrionivorans]|uniref:Uncharacterized protein n=1 Tax=Halobacteriovorax vibrionivorans TaxID=2152716 RepID=A0ABY0IFG4_9BACT|nr:MULTISPECIES: hypothetical protein [Halobacteriovorax]RZF21245.1 hypothetical protein DAY19_06060 [Halobacteriovorax vibrionivorans]TGD47997.1 hypothetical protein EP118_06070 [Halobacteriovorax sp. Y22]
MSKFLKSIMLVLIALTANASENQLNFSFNGGQNDVQVLAKEIEVTKYKQESYEGTCYNQVPYQDEECGYETKYRQECSYRTGRNVCHTEYERQCRYETKYRQRCTTGPSRQVCRDVPGQRICRDVNGRRVCNQRPGRRVCETKPGRQTCRREPYQDRVCNSRPVQRCVWEPGRNICRDVPYQDYVCRTVTKYRSEPYSCTKQRTVAYKDTENVTHKVKVEYIGAIDKADANFELSFANEMKSFQTVVENLNEESTQINFQVTDFNEVQDYNYESTLKVEFFDLDKARAPILVEPKKVEVSKKGKFELEVSNLEGVESLKTEIVIYDKEKKKLHFKKTLELLSFKKTQLSNGNILLTGELKEHGFEKIKKTLFGPFEKARKLKVTLTIFPLDSTVPGQELKSVTHTLNTEAEL